MANKKLDAKAFGLAVGIFWAVVLFIITIVSVYTGYASGFLGIIKGIYPGYSVTLLGSLVGLLYGFIDGLVGCYIFIRLYNYLLEKI